jgi:hypothetical protein
MVAKQRKTRHRDYKQHVLRGQKATFGRGKLRSVQPPTADIGGLSQHVRKEPTGDISHGA